MTTVLLLLFGLITAFCAGSAMGHMITRRAYELAMNQAQTGLPGLTPIVQRGPERRHSEERGSDSPAPAELMAATNRATDWIKMQAEAQGIHLTQAEAAAQAELMMMSA